MWLKILFFFFSLFALSIWIMTTYNRLVCGDPTYIYIKKEQLCNVWTNAFNRFKNQIDWYSNSCLNTQNASLCSAYHSFWFGLAFNHRLSFVNWLIKINVFGCVVCVYVCVWSVWVWTLWIIIIRANWNVQNSIIIRLK